MLIMELWGSLYFLYLYKGNIHNMILGNFLHGFYGLYEMSTSFISRTAIFTHSIQIYSLGAAHNSFI